MSKDFELLMISIDWEATHKYSKILRGQSPLKPNIIGGVHEYDVVMYTKENGNYYQIAIATEAIPFIETINSDGKKNHQKLFQIDKNLWIIKEEWRLGLKGGYHYCPSINTKGHIDIVLSKNEKSVDYRIKVDVNPNIEDFDFEALKDDFEGELWSLLTSNSSKAKTQTTEVRFSDKVFRFIESQLIIAFVHEFGKIAKNPKRELKHSISNLPFDKVKPIPATFQKLAVAGSDVLLPSKTFIDNFDNYENRFLCLMLYKIHQIVQYNSQFSIQQINKLNSEILTIRENIIQLQKPQIVSEEQVLAELLVQQHRITQNENKWKSISSRLNYNKSASYILKSVRLWKEHHQLSNTYWSYNPDFCLITFPSLLSSYLEEGASLNVEMRTPCSETAWSKAGNQYQIFNANDIKSIEGSDVELERNIFEKQKQNIEKLRNNNWQLNAILNVKERDKLQLERVNQTLTLQKRITKIETQIKSLNEFGNEIDQFKPFLTTLLNLDFVKRVNFKKLARFRPSMTYIQNIQYRNAFKYYKQILDAEGIDIGIFGLYEQITNYGIREMPQVFELWSLVSIIRILENTFSYKHNPNDLKQLLNSITPQNKKIDKYVKINFLGDLNGRSIILHYQKPLSNNKRPDLLLEICCDNRKIFVVLDSKFKNYNYKLSATYETQAMIEKYKISSDYFIFILHPCKDLNRGEYVVKLTNFGGEKVYSGDGQISFPFHNFGYLMIKPNETDNLKKIVGMSLEYLLERTHTAIDKNPKPEFNMLCCACGGNELAESKGTYPSGGHFYKYSCLNSECKHEVNISYCWSCKTKLFKHGSYWDYHRTSVWSIFDIHCPNCGMTVADKPNINYNNY